MPPSWADLFDRGAEYDGDIESIRAERTAIREEDDA
ncbi:hypothetical protein C478_18612 [Natrinema thermotolerans DSM 11552]|nr:hypothetical protein C478_18612 [Natrinema thermotolerans DSM 11552]